MKLTGKGDKEGLNYLDLVPKYSPEHEHTVSKDGSVTIYQENTGLFNTIAQKFFGKPRVSQIHLDELGSFIWRSIDGERAVNEIAELVKEEFGEKAEPLYNRLVQYMHTLEAYGFVELIK